MAMNPKNLNPTVVRSAMIAHHRAASEYAALVAADPIRHDVMQAPYLAQFLPQPVPQNRRDWELFWSTFERAEAKASNPAFICQPGEADRDFCRDTGLSYQQIADMADFDLIDFDEPADNSAAGA